MHPVDGSPSEPRLALPAKKRSVAGVGFVGVLVAMAALPLAALFWIAFGVQSDAWTHLTRYVLPPVAWHTMVLLLLVALGTVLVGTGTAWLVALCSFPGRRFFRWALVLPLAVPTYISAYFWVELP